MAIVVLLKPIITEKATKLTEKRNTYVFKIARDANKIEVKKAVEEAYGVKVENVNTALIVGKRKVRQTKKGASVGMKPSYKKAYVTLNEGETINFFGSV